MLNKTTDKNSQMAGREPTTHQIKYFGLEIPLTNSALHNTNVLASLNGNARKPSARVNRCLC